MSTIETTTTIVYTSDPKKEVSIAGNFTGWSPAKLKWNQDLDRFEYTVTPSDSTGKLSFKFIVDGTWLVDQNFASEFDEMGNENNVLLYDFSKEKNAVKSREDESKTAVQKEITEGPRTPDPTPMNGNTPPPTIEPVVPNATAVEPNPAPSNGPTAASKSVPKTMEPPAPITTSSPSTVTTGLPSETQNAVITAAPSEMQKSKSNPVSTTATKSTPKTKAPSEPATPSDVSTKAEKPPSFTDVPLPEPVARPSIPEPTAKATSVSKNVSPPEPMPLPIVDRKLPATKSNTSSVSKENTGSTNTGSYQVQNRVVSSSGSDAPLPKDWGFFANLLHIIAQFFKSWFSRGASA